MQGHRARVVIHTHGVQMLDGTGLGDVWPFHKDPPPMPQLPHLPSFTHPDGEHGRCPNCCSLLPPPPGTDQPKGQGATWWECRWTSGQDSPSPSGTPRSACEQQELQETSTAVMEDGSPGISQEAPESTGAQQRGQPGPWGYTSASHQL